MQRIIRQGPSNSLGELQLRTRSMSADINEKLQNRSIVQDAIDYLPEILYDNLSGQRKVEFWWSDKMLECKEGNFMNKPITLQPHLGSANICVMEIDDYCGNSCSIKAISAGMDCKQSQLLTTLHLASATKPKVC